MQPHQCRVQRDDHFHVPVVNTVSDTSQDAIGLLGHPGTLLGHVQPSINQYPQVCFFCAVFQPLCPNPVAFPGVVVAKVQDPALGIVEFHPIGLSPVIQPAQIPL